MAKESVHKKKERVRPPRVHITYDVEQNGATVQKELPFVVGVLADLAGASDKPLTPLRDRKFVEIDRDNFDDVMKNVTPGVKMKVENKLTDDDSELSASLKFEKLEDFRPENVAKQVEPLAKLLEIRNQLKDLLGRTEGNDRLEEMLNAILENESMRDKLKGTLGGEGGGGADGGEAGGDGSGDKPAEEGS